MRSMIFLKLGKINRPKYLYTNDTRIGKLFKFN